MRKLKIFFVVIFVVMLFASTESFAYPRHRVVRYYGVRPYYHRVWVRPVYRPVVVKKYYVVKRRPVYFYRHRHHPRLGLRIAFHL